MESARAPHCHRAHQCREHWHREEQGEDKGDDRIRIPVPVEWVLVWIVQVDAVVIMRLVRLILSSNVLMPYYQLRMNPQLNVTIFITISLYNIIEIYRKIKAVKYKKLDCFLYPKI